MSSQQLKGRRRSQRRSGLTLLELMIVLVILVGLLAIVGPKLLGSQQKADINTTKAQIGNLESALKSYVVDMKTYPDTETGLSALVSAPDDERLARMWGGPYIDADSLPLDPWGNEFLYENESSDSTRKPRIYSPGPDGEPDTEDDISNRAKDGEGESDSGESEDDL